MTFINTPNFIFSTYEMEFLIANEKVKLNKTYLDTFFLLFDDKNTYSFVPYWSTSTIVVLNVTQHQTDIPSVYLFCVRVVTL